MKYFRWSLVILVISFIFMQSIQNGTSSSGLSNKFTDFFYFDNPIISYDYFHLIIRKCAHFFEFAVLMTTIIFANQKYPLFKNRKQLIYLIAIISIPFIDECLQLFSDGRACSVYDMLLDASAMLFIIGIFYLYIAHKKANKYSK